MNQERSLAYGRVVKTLEDLGPAKLLPEEQTRIRDAADTLVFCPDGNDYAHETVAGIETLAHQLVESDRWTPETAERLLDDVIACGPSPALVG